MIVDDKEKLAWQLDRNPGNKTSSRETVGRLDIGPLSVHDIMEMLPHGLPFLMIDRLEDIVPGESAVGTKNVTINEQFFQGHFHAQAEMPGGLIIEAEEKTAAALVMEPQRDEGHGKGDTVREIGGGGGTA